MAGISTDTRKNDLGMNIGISVGGDLRVPAEGKSELGLMTSLSVQPTYYFEKEKSGFVLAPEVGGYHSVIISTSRHAVSAFGGLKAGWGMKQRHNILIGGGGAVENFGGEKRLNLYADVGGRMNLGLGILTEEVGLFIGIRAFYAPENGVVTVNGPYIGAAVEL